MENSIEGRNPVLELLRSNRPINRILLAKDIERHGVILEILQLIKKRGVPFEWLEKRVLNKKSSTGAHQGIIAYAASHEYCDIEDIILASKEKNEKALIVILDGIEDPQNLGAIIRSVECAGAHGVVIAKRRAVQLTEAVARVSAGAIEYVKVARVANIAETINKLKEQGIWVVGIEAGQEKSYTEVDFSLPTAIVIGGEGKGISRLVKERCEVLGSIPMKGKISSLNASVASAIIMYEALRQRGSLKSNNPRY